MRLLVTLLVEETDAWNQHVLLALSAVCPGLFKAPSGVGQETGEPAPSRSRSFHLGVSLSLILSISFSLRFYVLRRATSPGWFALCILSVYRLSCLLPQFRFNTVLKGTTSVAQLGSNPAPFCSWVCFLYHLFPSVSVSPPLPPSLSLLSHYIIIMFSFSFFSSSHIPSLSPSGDQQHQLWKRVFSSNFTTNLSQRCRNIYTLFRETNTVT